MNLKDELQRAETPQERRKILWENTFVACRNHPDRRANASAFVLRRNRRCKSCLKHYVDTHRLKEAYWRANQKHARLIREFGPLPKPMCWFPEEIEEITL